MDSRLIEGDGGPFNVAPV